MRAEKPSKKSKVADSKISREATSNMPRVANKIDRQPETKLQLVMRFGTCFFIYRNLLQKYIFFHNELCKKFRNYNKNMIQIVLSL